MICLIHNKRPVFRALIVYRLLMYLCCCICVVVFPLFLVFSGMVFLVVLLCLVVLPFVKYIHKKKETPFSFEGCLKINMAATYFPGIHQYHRP